MSIDYIAAGDTVPIAIRIMLSGTGVASTGVATVKISRVSDGFWFDFADSTFKAFASVGTLTQALTAVTNDLSRYAYAWNTGAIVNPVASDGYAATIKVTAPYAYEVTGGISTALIPAVRSGLALASALATAQTGITTLLSGVTVAAIGVDVITGTSIATTAVTKVQSGIATAATAASAVWATADGAGTMGAALSLLRRRVTNKRLMTALGVLRFYADDGTTIEKTSTVLDVNNAAVTPASGEASQASAEA